MILKKIKLGFLTVYKKICVNKKFYKMNKILQNLSIYGLCAYDNTTNRCKAKNNFFKKFFSITNCEVIFDVGGNTGEYVEKFKKHAPNAKIYSFEPHPKNFLKLKKMLKN